MKLDTTFVCSVCKQTKTVQTNGGTGYGYDRRNRKICYRCCGERDKAEMAKTGKAILYLCKATPEDMATNGGNARWEVTNWPGTLRFGAYVRSGRHNIAGTRYDAWFTGPDGRPWHGTQYGEWTQLCHCKRLKEAA